MVSYTFHRGAAHATHPDRGNLECRVWRCAAQNSWRAEDRGGSSGGLAEELSAFHGFSKSNVQGPRSWVRSSRLESNVEGRKSTAGGFKRGASISRCSPKR